MQACLQKMLTEIADNVVQYYIHTASSFLHLNQYIGRTFSIKHHHYQCQNCSLDIPIFAQGLCKKCYFESPMAGDWIMKPELSKAHIGIEDRNLEFETQMQLQPHIVYLALSGGLKVGVTRKSQVPHRWIDQGADYALPILEVDNRYKAGIAEVALKQHVSDKTNWRKMLTEITPFQPLEEMRDRLQSFLPTEVASNIIVEETVAIHYPIEELPAKVSSISLKKTAEFTKKLVGIKGQYWLFDDATVFNVRSHEGYVVTLDILA